MAYLESGHHLTPLSSSPVASLFDIETEALAKGTDDHDAAWERPPHDVQLVGAGAEVRVVALLPGVASAAGLDLEVEPDAIKAPHLTPRRLTGIRAHTDPDPPQVEAERSDGGKPYRLELGLACPVDDDAVQVRFDKGTGVLNATCALKL